MSQSIISAQQSIVFNVGEIIQSMKDNFGLSVSDIGVFTSKHLNYDLPASNLLSVEYQYEQYLFIEQTYCSKDGSRFASWFNCVPVSSRTDIIYNYIKKALTSFEGGCSTFKGKSHTSPETALRKLRRTLDESIAFEVFKRVNNNLLTFTFLLYEKDEEICNLLRQFNINIPTSFNSRYFPDHTGSVECYKIEININNIGKMGLVILLSSLVSYKADVMSSPVVNSSYMRKVTPQYLSLID